MLKAFRAGLLQFVTEGSRYRDEAGMPVKKRLKPDAVPTIFPLSIHGGGSGRSKTPL